MAHRQGALGLFMVQEMHTELYNIILNLVEAARMHREVCPGGNKCSVSLFGLRQAAVILARDLSPEEQDDLREHIKGIGF